MEGGRLILRLSHSMTAGPTALHVLGQTFKEIVEAKTNGAVIVRVFASGTLGQERETVQQVQEGLIDFMVSGSAIWGSVAPKLQVLDFPFLWRDWAHVHRIVDGAAGQRAADYLEQTVRMRPLAWGDSFGFRNVVTRSRDITDPSRLAGLKIRTIQSSIYVKTVELMGASPTPMAFGEVYTSLQTGVIDGFEHDASTTLQQRFYEVAGFLTYTRHIAGVLGLWSSTTTMAQLPADIRAVLAAAALEASAAQRARGPIEDAVGDRDAARTRHADPRHRRPRLAAGGGSAVAARGPRPRRRPPGSRPSSRERAARRSGRRRDADGSRARPGGGRAGRRAGRGRRSPGRRPSRPAPADPVDRGSRAPAPRLADVRRRHPRAAARAASARHRRRAPALAAPSRRGRSRAAPGAAGAVRRADRTVLDADPRQRRRAAAGERPVRRVDHRDPAGRARADVPRGDPRAVARRPDAVARAHVGDLGAGHHRGDRRLGAGAAPGRRVAAAGAGDRLPRHRRARPAAGVHAGADRPHLPDRHRRRRPRHPADQDPRRRRLVRAAGDSAVHPRRRADGDRRHLRAHRRSGDGDRGQGPRRPGDGRGRRRDPVLRHLGIDGGGRVGDQRAAGAVDAARRLLGPGIGQHRRRGLGDGHPGAAVPDDGRARLARQPVDRHAVPGRLRAGLHPGGLADGAHRAFAPAAPTGR